MLLSNKGTGEQSPEPFRIFAEKYLDTGLSVFPCGGDDGKRPLVKWVAFQSRRIGGKGLDKWLKKHAMANIGIATGKLSNLTVVDSDNPAVSVNELFKVYGETPIVVQTPSGGYHLYYAHNGELNSQDANLKIDIRGQGGFVIAPPSFSPVTGEMYYFVMGGICDFEELPFMNPQLVKPQGYSKGERNKTLFDYIRKQALQCCDKDYLFDKAWEFNQAYLEPPLEDNEVEKVISSVWGYKEQGKLFQQGKQTLVLEVDKIEMIRFRHPRALAMYIDLLSCHNNINKPFSIGLKGYAKRSGWSDKTIAQERDVLIQHDLIKCVHKGGSRKGDSSKYRFT